MTKKIPFWRQANVIGGLSLFAFGYFVPMIIAIVSKDIYKLLMSEWTIKISTYQFSINSALMLAGIVWLLYPKLKELGIFNLLRRMKPNGPSSGIYQK